MSPTFSERVGERIGKRTQRIGREVYEHLLQQGTEQQASDTVARYIAFAFGKLNESGKGDPRYTRQLVFIPPEERVRAKAAAEKVVSGASPIPPEWEKYLASGATGDDDPDEEDQDADARKSKKEKKAKKPKTHPLASSLLLTADSAADVAMFGRMLADSPGYNREAAVQVAHALTTHAAEVEDDYYVAVEDLKRREDNEDAGTSFIGVQEFGAGLFYLYACVDCDLLAHNLGGDAGLARDALGALVECAATVSPRGKQASFASRARASYVLAECGGQQPRSLAAAFLKPVAAQEGKGDARGDVARISIDRLAQFRGNLDAAYGVCADRSVQMVATPFQSEGTLAEVVRFAQECVPGAAGAGA